MGSAQDLPLYSKREARTVLQVARAGAAGGAYPRDECGIAGAGAQCGAEGHARRAQKGAGMRQWELFQQQRAAVAERHGAVSGEMHAADPLVNAVFAYVVRLSR
jgi:hypothetical protein